MDATHVGALNALSLTALVFGMLHECPHACGRACPFYTVRQVDLATTFYYIKSLSRADKLWMVRRYENCPVRLGLGRDERRVQPRHADCRGFDRTEVSGA